MEQAEIMGMDYVWRNFFTHKDKLVSADLIPGTIMTKECIVFLICLTAFIIAAAAYVGTRKHLIRKTLMGLWVFFVIWEVVIITYDSIMGASRSFDFAVSLSLYPCSLYLYSMPFILWGKGKVKWTAESYIMTLGLVGGTINLVYPIGQLGTYSCFSFVGFHSLFYHANIIFTYLVFLISDEFRYQKIKDWRYLFYPSIPTILLSIPANIVNYSPINSDYMYFTGEFPLLELLFPYAPDWQITAFMYSLYIFIPPFFFLPSFISNKLKEKREGLGNTDGLSKGLA